MFGGATHANAARSLSRARTQSQDTGRSADPNTNQVDQQIPPINSGESNSNTARAPIKPQDPPSNSDSENNTVPASINPQDPPENNEPQTSDSTQDNTAKPAQMSNLKATGLSTGVGLLVAVGAFCALSPHVTIPATALGVIAIAIGAVIALAAFKLIKAITAPTNQTRCSIVFGEEHQNQTSPNAQNQS